MKIHQWFIPTKKNKFHPIALRSTGLIIFLALFIAIPFIYNVTSAKQFKVLGYATNVNVSDLYNLSNQERANVGLSPLILNSSLNSAAQAKANDMMAKNYWAHVAPDGTTPWAFILDSGYQYTAAGENLAKDFNSSSGVVAGWMASPLHKANILNTSYKDVGYAVVNGILQGSETTLVVAMYGAQAEPVAAPVAGPAQTDSVSESPQILPTQPTTDAQPIEISPTTDETTPNPVTITQKQTAVAKQKETSQSINQATGVPTVAANTKSDSGSVEGISISVPIKAYNSLNWGQKVSLLLTSTLILLFIMKHTLIWREQKRGFRHVWLRAHPLGQVAILTTVMIVTVASSVGVVL